MPLYRQRKDATTNAGTQITVSFDPILPDTAIHCAHAVLQNNSGENVTAQLGILEGTDFFPLQGKQTVATGDATALVAEFYIFPGQQLAAQVKGTSNKAAVTLYASGEQEDLDPPSADVPVPLAAQQTGQVRGY